MDPSGQMGGSYYDPWAGNYGAGCTMPCCSAHGCSYCYPPGPATPYQHMYPSPHPYVAPRPLMPPYHHHHHPHYYPMPGAPAPAPAPASCCVLPDAPFPIQQQPHQQHQTTRPMVMPLGNCCCGRPNYHSDYGNPWSSVPSNDAKVSNGPEPESEDVNKVDSVRPSLWSDGSNSSPPQLFWIPPQYVSNLQQQDANKGTRDGKGCGQLIPFNLDKLASLHNKNSNKPITAGGQKDYPFPIILMPRSSDESREITVRNRISEIEEKPSSCNNTEPLKLLCNADVERTVPPEPVKTSEPHNDSISQGLKAQPEKVRVKDIPVKQADESKEKKPPTNAAAKSRSRSISPTKTTKLPPICLRVDPLPRKKSGNGTPKPLSSPSYQKDTQQPVQTGSAFEDLNSKKIEVSEARTTPNTDNTKNVKMVKASSDETGNVSKGEIMESKKAAQPEAPVVLEGGSANDVKIRKRISEETAAVRIQSAYRGYEERKWHSLQKLRQIAKVREQISGIKDRLRALENSIDMNKEEFERQKLLLGETIMSHLLTLDTIQGLHPSIRDVRKSVAKDLISVQEKLDLFYAQRLREKGDVADNSEINEGPSRKSDEQDSSDMIFEGGQQENKQKESYRENISPLGTSVDNSENLAENICADLHQKEAHADDSRAVDTQDATRPIEDSPQEGSLQNLNTGRENDSKLMSSRDEVEVSGKQITKGILKQQTLEGGNNCSVAKAVSEYESMESMANSNVVAVDSQTVETNQTVIEGEESNPFCCTTADIGEVISREVVADANVQVSKLGEEPAVESCGETIEQVCSHAEKQSELQPKCSEYECLDEQGTITTNTSASEEIFHRVEEIDKLATSHICSDDKFEEASEIHVCEENRTNEISSQENMTICELAGIDNSEQLSSEAANESDAIGKGITDTGSEGSVITDNGSGAGTLEAGAVESDKGNEKSRASFEDANCLAEDKGNGHETPRLSNVSRPSTDDANSVVLAEENEKLRETVRKLLELEKEQLAVISTLSGRVRDLEKKLKKKRNRKIKLHKSSNKNHETDDQKIPICSM